ncbi:MAG: SDR family oxidoreductase [Methylobacteriaceae bacterium]|nr:SDR family oxidoreductase [Methylobacteriaceae bacterium]
MTSSGSLAGKTALVIGGVGGIGAASAKLFAEAGAKVALTHRPGKEAAARAAPLIAALAGKGHIAVAADVAETKTLIAARDEIERAFGRLDILVNSAGFTKPIAHGDLDALDDDFIDRMFAVNWRGQFAAVRTFAPMLKASGDGLIVNISSIAALNGAGSNIAYGAAKAGIDVMGKSLARALAPEVRVMTVSPGVVATGFVPGRGAEFNEKAAASTPLKRVATAEDVAEAVLACATHLSYSTGATIIVDGGRTL